MRLSSWLRLRRRSAGRYGSTADARLRMIAMLTSSEVSVARPPAARAADRALGLGAPPADRRAVPGERRRELRGVGALADTLGDEPVDRLGAHVPGRDLLGPGEVPRGELTVLGVELGPDARRDRRELALEARDVEQLVDRGAVRGDGPGRGGVGRGRGGGGGGGAAGGRGRGGGGGGGA